MCTLLDFECHRLRSFSSCEKSFNRQVDFLAQEVEQENYIEDDINGHKVHQVEAEIVPRIGVGHKISVVEHEPDAYYDGHLVEHLDEVVEVIIHREYRKEVGKYECAEDVAQEDLQYN